jgi:hypothetical protein
MTPSWPASCRAKGQGNELVTIAQSTRCHSTNGRDHAESTHLADGKFAGLSSVGVGIVGRCEKLCQRLKVHLLSFCIADAE